MLKNIVMADTPETMVRFSKDLMKEVMRACDYTNHSAKAFIEECVRACLEQIDTEGDTVTVSDLVAMARRKKGRATRTVEDIARATASAEWSAKTHDLLKKIAAAAKTSTAK
ncbi:MAG: hypothetical protein LBK60_10625 [Verrucomicrobiales bacterium]|jgi:hypothetical protein|nr:hypothetical protein [Verrucomicrobiales bacterium]